MRLASLVQWMAGFAIAASFFAGPSATGQTAPGGSVNDQQKFAATDWPWWRGPARTGEANPDQLPPVTWSETENVLWKAEIPGRGHGSPTIVGNKIFLATANEEIGSQSVVCLERKSGKLLWTTEVHASGAMKQHEKSSAASCTLACDGERVFVCFPNSDAIQASALTLDGKIAWQTKVGQYVVHQGYGSSPAIYQSLVIVSADSKVVGGTVAGIDRKSGEIVWKHARPKLPNYTSPVIFHLDGKDQVILTGCSLVSSLEPLTGKVIWEMEGATEECVTSTVTDGKRVYSSGGYPKNHIAAVLADGSKTISWETADRVYVPSMLFKDEHLFGVMDAGVAACWWSDTGKEAWKRRLGGTFSASPVLVGNKIYATNETGQTFVYEANTEKYKQIATNQLGDEAFATQVICGGKIYARVTKQVDGKRKEFLFCIGNAIPGFQLDVF